MKEQTIFPDPPLVTVLTPVYNGGKFLAECIESVLAQTYRHFEYVIIENCSTDGTLEIVREYAAKDDRIRVVSNDRHVGVIENHNIAFSCLSPASKYCKVVSADDWITPDCVEKLVQLGELYLTAKIIGSYQRSGNNVRWKGLPVEVSIISGREVCRSTLLDNLDVFGTPTSLLYRSDIIRQNRPFFPHPLPHADTSSCFKYLRSCDFGFVHEILSAERVHARQVSARVNKVGAGNVASLDNFLAYGPCFLTELEFETRKRHMFQRYYRWLGGSVLKMEGPTFWRYQTSRLRELGFPIYWHKVMVEVVRELVEEMGRPIVAVAKLVNVLKAKTSRSA